MNRDIELKLRIAHIAIDTKATSPMLIMDVMCLPIRVSHTFRGYAIHIRLNVLQYILIEETKQHGMGIIYETVGAQACSTESCPDEIRSAGKDMTDEFTNAFLKANEKQ